MAVATPPSYPSLSPAALEASSLTAHALLVHLPNSNGSYKSLTEEEQEELPHLPCNSSPVAQLSSL